MPDMLKSAFSDLHDARFKTIYSDAFKGYDTVFDKVFNSETSDRSYEKYSSVGEHDIAQETGEEEQVSSDARIQGYDITLTNRKFTLQAKISYENIKDDQFRELDKEAKKLAVALKRTPDVLSADAFKYGFTTADRFGGSMTAADGIRHFSTLHYKNPDETGTTYSNASDAGSVFSADNLETATIALQEQRNDRGMLAGCVATKLIVPLALRKQALAVTGSDKEAQTADNDVNVRKEYQRFYGGTLEVIVWPELGAVTTGGSDTAWYLMDPNAHQMIFQWREQPTVGEVVYDEDKMRYKYTGFERWEFGMVDWRGVWGSKGDGAAYAS